ncbi:heterokaryon incompatibility protein-domain-containing protein [Aspergillus floccosus]
MRIYRYLKLNKDEIRLISDRIKISISHLSLPPSTHDITRPVTLQILFYFEDADDNWKSSWEHPDRTVDLRPCEIPTRRPKPFHYEALSYTWGEDHGSETASPHDTQLRISGNMALALRHLQFEDRRRSLWVDAMCINQDNLSEREQQVQRMSTIFREADRVVVVNTMVNWNISYPEAVMPDWCYSRYAITYSTVEWAPINAFLHRDCFSRVWAVLQCGLAQTSWSYFRRAVIVLWGKQDPCPFLSRHKLSFIEWLANVLKVTPQYSLPVGDVYLAFVRANIEHVEHLELLKNCQLHGRTINALSWASDLSSKFPILKGAKWQFVSGYAECDVRFEGSTLSVLRVHSATVRTVSLLIPNHRSEKDHLCFANSMGECDVTDNAAFPINNVLTLHQWKEHPRSPNLFGESMDSENEKDLPFQEEFALGFLLGRVYMTTDEGYVGLGPPGTEPGDQVVSPLGCDSPMVLRKGPHGGFLVVGECVMPELNDSRDFLGPLPSPWRVQYFKDSSDRYGVYRYSNAETGALSDQDPRTVGASDWQSETVNRTGDDPVTFRAFRNKVSGDIVKSDPCLTPQALQERGVTLAWFMLV